MGCHFLLQGIGRNDLQGVVVVVVVVVVVLSSNITPVVI